MSKYSILSHNILSRVIAMPLANFVKRDYYLKYDILEPNFGEFCNSFYLFDKENKFVFYYDNIGRMFKNCYVNMDEIFVKNIFNLLKPKLLICGELKKLFYLHKISYFAFVSLYKYNVLFFSIFFCLFYIFELYNFNFYGTQLL